MNKTLIKMTNSDVKKWIILFVMLSVVINGMACTSAIISGKLTSDGRPILWKNRDTGNLKNCIRYFHGEKYNYIGIIESLSEHVIPKSVWIGSNEKGFSIMNTLSYNLSDSKDKSASISNGSLMKKALGICATVEDFKHLLDTLKRPLHISSNYGVIDANGNAFYFEVNDINYVSYNVNDNKVAPKGYLVRTNYSFSGKRNVGMGYVRYMQAEKMIYNVSDKRVINPEWLFENLSRSFVNPLMGVDLTSGKYNKPYTNGWFSEEDFIARKKSACAVAIQGVKSGEKPELTTMWTVLGYPPVTPAVPLWVKGADKSLPLLLQYNEKKKDAPLCYAANELRDSIYSFKFGDNAQDYFNWELLYNASGTGYLQRLTVFERSLFISYYEIINNFYKREQVDVKEVGKLYNYADRCISEYLKISNNNEN